MAQTPQDMISAANENQDVPKIYANSFSCSLGASDVSLLFQRSSEPLVLVNMSFTTAKTLIAKLNGLINYLEEKSEKAIMTIDDIKEYFSDSGDEDAAS